MIRNEMRDKTRNSKYFQNAEHILQSAIEQFKDTGYAASSINDICEKAGISRSTFYNIFSQKKDILIYMYDRLNYEKNFRDYDPEVQANALEILWNKYKRYLILAEILGPKLLGELMQIEVRDSIGMRDAVQSQYVSWANLVKECREQGIMEFWGTPEERVSMTSDAIFFAVQNWCYNNGAYSIQPLARHYLEMGCGVKEEYRKNITE